VQSASASSSADQPAPPAVRVVVPTRDPGPWFDDVIAALAAQDYPAMSVTVVHGQDEGSLLERHRETLPGLDLVAAPDAAGFGTKINAVAETASEDLLLIHHDDVAMEPGALSSLVKEWLRRNEDRTAVAAKLLDWSDPTQLMPAGFDADRFGVTASTIKPGDLDQGQQDRIVDIFGTSTACLLINRNFFCSIGGFDEAIDWHGEAYDLALRTRSVGGQVVIAAPARARHRSAFEGRNGPPSSLRERRHQLRSALAAAPARSLPLLLLSFIATNVLELIVALVRFDIPNALSIPGAWLWNIANVGSLFSRRRAITSIETFSGNDLKLIRRRGSILLSESIDRRVSQREIATESGEATVSVIRVAGGVTTGLILAFGARHLFTRPIPAIGEFRVIPDDLGTLTADWWSGLRTWGMGSEGFASFALPLLDVLGVATLGSVSLLRIVLMVAPIPIGVIGVWKLFSRTSSDAAPVAAAVLYAASPLPYNAISGGSATALALYALLPWLLSNMIAVTRRTSLGPERSMKAATIAIGALGAVLVAIAPYSAAVIAFLVLGVVVGSLLSGDMRGVVPLVTSSAIGLAIAGLVNLPFLLGIASWDQFSSTQTTGATDTSLVQLFTLSTGTVGSTILGWAIFAPALLPLIAGTGERFTWAVRIWGAMLVTWAVAWAGVRGWLPIGLPVLEVVLAPIALGFAMLGGLAALVIDIDLSGARLRRLIPAAVAVIGLALAAVPLLVGTSSGRWELARVDLSTTYGAIEPGAEDGTYRVLWVGDAHVLGAASIPTANGLAWTSSLDGVPDVRALWGGLDRGANSELSEVIAAGLDGRTSRLGRQLSLFGVRYIVVMDQQAPVPESSRRNVVTDIRAAGLNGQLDLVRDGVVNPAVAVYRNTAWSPVHSAVAPGALGALRIDDADPAVVTRTSHDVFDGQTRVERDVYAAWEPSPRWTLTVAGQVVPRVDIGAVGIGFDTSELSDTDAQLRYETSDLHRIVVLLQAAAWVAMIAIRRWWIGAPRRAERQSAARAERVG
jgi:GT2 family glycosyltransferase